MANTGVLNYIELDQVLPPCPPCTPTGLHKPNVEGDPDYIPPGVDLVRCPITVTLDCPSYSAASGGVGIAQAAVTIYNSVLSNPVVAKVRLSLTSAGTNVNSFVFTLPNTNNGNYFYHQFTQAAGTYQLRVEYLNSSDVVQATCSDLATITIT